jgi:hypothetical protein
MKQYTSKDQTTKLIELGFPKPQGWGNKDISNGMSIALYNDGREDFNYSIGELIGFLCNPVIECLAEVWRIEYDGSKGQQFIEEDLIDALYKACIYFKENPQYD